MAALLSDSWRALVRGPLWIGGRREKSPPEAAAAAAAAFSRAWRLGGAEEECDEVVVDLRFCPRRRGGGGSVAGESPDLKEEAPEIVAAGDGDPASRRFSSIIDLEFGNWKCVSVFCKLVFVSRVLWKRESDELMIYE